MGGESLRSFRTLLVCRLLKSLSHLISPNTKQVDNKRLAIELSALKKQLIWDNCDDCDEEVDGPKGYHPRWIDTCAILSNEDDDFWPIE